MMEARDFLVILGAAAGGFFVFMAVLFFLRQNPAVQRFKHMLFASPWLWMLQDISVLGQCLLASLSLYELIPSNADCSPYSAFYYFSNIHNGSAPIYVQYPWGGEIKRVCEPEVPSLQSSRKMLLGVIVLSQIVFAAAIFLRATGFARRHATFLYFFICASALVLAVGKMATVAFIIIKTTGYRLQFSCDDSALHACSNKKLFYKLQDLPAFHGCTGKLTGKLDGSAACTAEFDCQALCKYPRFDMEVYLLMFNFLLSFFYIVYLMTEYFNGQAHLSIFEDFKDRQDSRVALEEYRKTQSNRFAYRNIRNVSALAKMIMALGSIAAILYNQDALIQCRDFSCTDRSGTQIITKGSDVSSLCDPTFADSSAVYQYIFATSAVFCIGLFILGNQLSLKGHFAAQNKPIIITTALLQMGAVLLLMWCIAILTQIKLSFRKVTASRYDTDANHVKAYTGYTYNLQFNSTSPGCPTGEDIGSCDGFCEIVVPSSLTYLLGIMAMSVWFMGFSLFEYRQMALMRLRGCSQNQMGCTLGDDRDSKAVCVDDLQTPFVNSNSKPSEQPNSSDEPP